VIHSSPEFGLIVASAQSLLRGGRFAAIATLETGSNHPFASLIAVATEPDGAPVFLISRLALHTRNLEADSRATLLLSQNATHGDPLNEGRISLKGTAERSDDPASRRSFLARHPDAALYAEFADFGIWRFRIEAGHYVGGFGKIVTLRREDLLLSPEAAALWQGAADGVIEKLNETRPDLAAKLTGRQGEEQAGWRIAAFDAYGCDIVCGTRGARIAFPEILRAPADLEEALECLPDRVRS
jgi:putative heme iron utilization protein